MSIIGNPIVAGGSSAELGTKSITANGTYVAVDDNLDGYSSVTVAVEGSTLVDKTITANGTYDPADDSADGYSSVTVNVNEPFTSLTDYIESTGTQYINSNYILSDNSWIEVVATVESGNNAALFGTRSVATGEASARACLMYAGTPSSTNLFYQFGNDQSNIGSAMSGLYGKKTCFRLKRGFVCAFTDEEFYKYGTPFLASASVNTTYPLYILNLNNIGNPGTSAVCKLYRFRIYESDTLALDLVPHVDSNNVVCLSDTLTDTLYYNVGTGNFTFGTDS